MAVRGAESEVGLGRFLHGIRRKGLTGKFNGFARNSILNTIQEFRSKRKNHRSIILISLIKKRILPKAINSSVIFHHKNRIIASWIVAPLE
jgi:hypothetical protein